MLRNVYLHGELGERFGKKFSIHSDNYGDIIRCINANRPEFLPYLRQCHEDNISIKVENEEVDEQEILLPIQKGDVSIAIVPAGAKSGVGKLIAAAFLVFVALPAIGGMVTAGATAGTAFGGAQGAYGMMMSAGFGTIG